MDHRRQQLCILSVFVMLAVVLRVQARESADGKTLSFGNRKSQLLLDARHFTLVDIVDSVQDIHYVVEPGGPLFSINFYRETETTWQSDRMWVVEGHSAKKRWYEDASSAGVNRIKLHYDGCPVGETGRAVDVTVTVEIADGESVFYWSLALRNKSALPLNDVRFPTLRGLGSSVPGSANTDFVVVPYNSGVKKTHPRRKLVCNEGWANYPGYALTVQLLPYCDGQGRGCLYFATEDAEGYRKTFVNAPMDSRKSFITYAWHYADGRTDAEGKWELPYRVGAGPLIGDYYDAAKWYRRWMLSTKHWKPLSRRDDIPEWFLDLSVWFSGWARWDKKPPETMDEYANTLLALRETLGEDFGLHWYMWYDTRKMDYAYPQYLPAQPGFKEAVAKVQQAGVHVMPYVNVHLFDTLIPMWKEDNAAQWAVRNKRGELQKQRAGWKPPARANVSMCIATDYWQDKLAGIYASLVNDYGVDAVYMDELHTFPALCQARNHGHLPGCGGTAFSGGYRRMIEKVKALSNKPIAITGEAVTETYADIVSGQLSGFVDLDPDPVFLFQFVMSDRTIDYGMSMHRLALEQPDSFAAKVGFSFVNGRQLLWSGQIKGRKIPKLADNKPILEMLIRFARARRAGKDFLLYGEFLRKPDLGALPRHDVLWKTFRKKTIEPVSMRTVQASVYRAENGDIGLVLANISGREQTVTIPTNTKDWGLVPGTTYSVTEWRSGAWSDPEKKVMGRILEVAVPPYSPIIVRYAAGDS